MSTALAHALPVDERATLLALARADARRYARHPLFLVPCAILVVIVVANVIQRKGGGTNPLVDTMTIAFFLGVFGFVVAHRLTTSLLHLVSHQSGASPLLAGAFRRPSGGSRTSRCTN